jgi:hypothetical protein
MYCTPTYTYVQMTTITNTYIRIYIHKHNYNNEYLHTHIRTYVQRDIYIYIYIYIYENTHTHVHTHIQFQHFITDKMHSQVICLVIRECIKLTRAKHVRFPNFSISKLRTISKFRHRLLPVQCGWSFKPYSTLNFYNILKNI